jgi:hypothetical protein
MARASSPSLTATRSVPVESKFFNQSAAAAASAEPGEPAGAAAPDQRKLIVKLKLPPKVRNPEVAPSASIKSGRKVSFGPATLDVSTGGVEAMDTHA